jgi:hypothetical protein
MTCRASKNALLFLAFFGLIGCLRQDTGWNPAEWGRVSTEWTGVNGQRVALYERPTALSRNPEAIVCESRTKSLLVRLKPETFAFVEGTKLVIFDTANRMTPGWYLLKKTHGLSWWERNVYTSQSLGGWTAIGSPPDLPIGRIPNVEGVVYLYSDRTLRKVAQEAKLSDLTDIDGEGVMYVSEPGIGVRAVYDMPAVCR